MSTLAIEQDLTEMLSGYLPCIVFCKPWNFSLGKVLFNILGGNMKLYSFHSWLPSGAGLEARVCLRNQIATVLSFQTCGFFGNSNPPKLSWLQFYFLSVCSVSKWKTWKTFSRERSQSCTFNSFFSYLQILLTALKLMEANSKIGNNKWKGNIIYLLNYLRCCI